VHHVAERRRLDQQNSRELGGFERRVLRLVDMCCFDLAIQFAKIYKERRFSKALPGRARHSVRAVLWIWMRRAEDCPPYQVDWREFYAAFFAPDNAPRSFFIHAEKR
jgi:hypothetical protein